ncbi:hypothetical protein BpHYR1_001338 [Brachionus plicatilis]|uniref:Uncharacterized protein n=1 Tax=Brachionus plicatilis TaxID=10195 RepID=A0A3M7QAF0_BRAPC|nr:hypothetical protein BpHYR1_001338 [Brachionus plicatilis]
MNKNLKPISTLITNKEGFTTTSKKILLSFLIVILEKNLRYIKKFVKRGWDEFKIWMRQG